MAKEMPVSGFQRAALRGSRLLSGIALVLVVLWASGEDDVGKKMLGGKMDSLSSFSWHPVMMVLAFTVFMGEGVQAFRLRFGKPINKKIHAGMHGCALVAVLIALRAVFASHNKTKAPNLYTAHGIVGLTVCVLFFAQYVVGALAFLTNSVFSVGEKAALVGPHALVGICVYFFAVAAIVSGVAEKTAWLGCNYYKDGNAEKGKVTLTEPDLNPAEHYPLLPIGCRLGIGVAVSALLSAFLVAIGVLSPKFRSNGSPAYHHPADSVDSTSLIDA